MSGRQSHATFYFAARGSLYSEIDGLALLGRIFLETYSPWSFVIYPVDFFVMGTVHGDFPFAGSGDQFEAAVGISQDGTPTFPLFSPSDDLGFGNGVI